jgi:cytidylate kinase
MAARVVCISRTVGAHGEEIGRLVAERLGYSCVDEEIVARAAAREGLDVRDVASAEQRKGWLTRFFAATGGESRDPEMSGFGTFGGFGGGDSTETYRELIQDAILETAARGAVVIVAHAASHALVGHEDVLRVLVTASPSVRSRRLAEARGVDEHAATKEIKESDAARADYLKRFYGIDHELPTHYDLVLSTDAIGSEQAASVIVHTAEAVSSPTGEQAKPH